MTPDLWKMLIGAVVLLLTEAAGLLKIYSELAKVKAARADTAKNRDADSQEIRDRLLKVEFLTTQLKDNQSLQATVIDDLRDTCATLNTNIVKLDMAVSNLADAIKELKR